MAQTTKPKAKKPSRTARLAKIRARADEIGRAIRIRKSRIAAGGGGAFTTVPIKRGECVGFYLGAAGKRSENRDYIVEGDGGPSRDAYDEAGRLVVDGRKINCHGWNAEDWQKLKREATCTCHPGLQMPIGSRRCMGCVPLVLRYQEEDMEKVNALHKQLVPEIHGSSPADG